MRVVDIDGVKMLPLGVVEDVPHWHYLIYFFFYLTGVVNLVLHGGDSAVAKLWGRRCFGGSVVWDGWSFFGGAGSRIGSPGL